MRRDKLSRQNIILCCLGIIPVVWLGLLIAPYLSEGMIGLIKNFSEVMNDPLRITLCEDSLRTVLTLLFVYAIILGIFLSSERNYRRREEHGSARWGIPERISRKYTTSPKSDNKILTQNVSISLDERRHGRNLNTLVCGGSGSGKTRYFAKPNIMNCNTSYCVLDPKRAIFKDNICGVFMR